jgi:hypothetical protein
MSLPDSSSNPRQKKRKMLSLPEVLVRPNERVSKRKSKHLFRPFEWQDRKMRHQDGEKVVVVDEAAAVVEDTNPEREAMNHEVEAVADDTNREIEIVVDAMNHEMEMLPVKVAAMEVVVKVAMKAVVKVAMKAVVKVAMKAVVKVAMMVDEGTEKGGGEEDVVAEAEEDSVVVVMVVRAVAIERKRMRLMWQIRNPSPLFSETLLDSA